MRAIGTPAAARKAAQACDGIDFQLKRRSAVNRAWWERGVAVQPGAVAREAKQMFLSYYSVFPEACLRKFAIK